MSPSDPFPRTAFEGVVRHAPSYLRLAWRLAREPLLSRARRAAVVGAAGYLASPIDAIPGVIPVLGQLDDIAVAIAAIRFALGGLNAERRAAHLSAVGLTDADLRDDLGALGLTAAWTVRSGARLGVRATRTGVRAAIAAARAGKGPAARAAGRAGDAARSFIRRRSRAA